MRARWHFIPCHPTPDQIDRDIGCCAGTLRVCTGISATLGLLGLLVGLSDDLLCGVTVERADGQADNRKLRIVEKADDLLIASPNSWVEVMGVCCIDATNVFGS